MVKTASFLFALGVEEACLKLLCEHNAKIRSSITAHIAHLHARPEATSNVRLASNIILGIHTNVHLTHIFPLFVPSNIYTKANGLFFCFHFNTLFTSFSSAQYKNVVLGFYYSIVTRVFSFLLCILAQLADIYLISYYAQYTNIQYKLSSQKVYNKALFHL